MLVDGAVEQQNGMGCIDGGKESMERGKQDDGREEVVNDSKER